MSLEIGAIGCMRTDIWGAGTDNYRPDPYSVFVSGTVSASPKSDR
jgi:hypothetical protein